MPAQGGAVGLRFDPIGGGRFKEVVRAIIENDRQPIRSLEGRKALVETKMKLFQEFKTKFSGFKKAVDDISGYNKLKEFKVELGNGEGLLDVTIDKEKALPGTYQIEIEELAARSSIITNQFESPAEANLGIGFVVVHLPNGDDFEVFVDDKDASLAGIAKLINETPDAPVQASVVQDAYVPGKPWRLLVSAKKDGDPNGVVFPEFYFLGGEKDFWIDDRHDSQNAYLKIDNFEIEGESNSIKDFLQGVNIHLKEAKPGQPFTLKIGQDFEKITGKVKAVVDQINGVLDFIGKQNAVDEKSDTRAMFTGDTGLQTVEYRLRNITHEGFLGAWDEDGEPKLVFLSQMGIEIGRNGQLTFKEDKLKKSMEDNFEMIAEALSGNRGFARQLGKILEGYTRAGDGLIDTREKAFRTRMQQIDDQIADHERRIETKTVALTEKFSRLQGALSNLQQQQQYLGATLGGGGNNLVQTLLGG